MERFEKLVAGSNKNYELRRIPLDAAYTDHLVQLGGQSLAFWTNGSLAALSVKLNNTGNEEIPLPNLRHIPFPFQQLYLTSDAQAGKSLWLLAPKIPAFLQMSQAPGNPTIYNVALTLANTEYSQALPANTKKFSVSLRDATGFRIAFVTGKVAAPTAPYKTILDGCEYYEEDLNLQSVTIYLASPAAGKAAEIICWD